MSASPFGPLTILRLTLAASLVSLLAAFISQYALGLKPCHLCIAQRVPFAVVVILALWGLAQSRLRTLLIALIAVTFFINSGIAAYHMSVEKHWVAGPSGCTTEESPAAQSMDDFLKHIQNAPVVACDQPQWEFHGVTMASLNMAWSFLLAAATFVALRQFRRKETPQ